MVVTFFDEGAAFRKHCAVYLKARPRVVRYSYRAWRLFGKSPRQAFFSLDFDRFNKLAMLAEREK